MRRTTYRNYEKEFCKILQQQGYWAHNFEYSQGGQPCDIVAIKDDKALLIDVKHCEGDRFTFDRIEPNQRTCFEYANKCGNFNTFFAIYFEKYNEWRAIRYSFVLDIEECGKKSVRYDEILGL